MSTWALVVMVLLVLLAAGIVVAAVRRGREGDTPAEPAAAPAAPGRTVGDLVRDRTTPPAGQPVVEAEPAVAEPTAAAELVADPAPKEEPAIARPSAEQIDAGPVGPPWTRGFVDGRPVEAPPRPRPQRRSSVDPALVARVTSVVPPVPAGSEQPPAKGIVSPAVAEAVARAEALRRGEPGTGGTQASAPSPRPSDGDGPRSGGIVGSAALVAGAMGRAFGAVRPDRDAKEHKDSGERRPEAVAPGPAGPEAVVPGAAVREVAVSEPALRETADPEPAVREAAVPEPRDGVTRDQPRPVLAIVRGGADLAEKAERPTLRAVASRPAVAEVPGQASAEEDEKAEAVVAESVTAEPVTAEPTATEPVATKPAAAEPVTAGIVEAAEPAVAPVAAVEPAAVRPGFAGGAGLAAVEPVIAEPEVTDDTTAAGTTAVDSAAAEPEVAPAARPEVEAAPAASPVVAAQAPSPAPRPRPTPRSISPLSTSTDPTGTNEDTIIAIPGRHRAPDAALDEDARAAEHAAVDLALLRTLGFADPNPRPGAAPVVDMSVDHSAEEAAAEPTDPVPVRFRVFRHESPVAGAAVSLLDARGRETAAARTDAEGRGDLTAPRPGGYVLVASAEGHQSGVVAVTAAATGTDVEVHLLRACAVAGTVSGPKGPAAGVAVTLLQDGELVATVCTDATGGYRFTDLDAGAYTVVAQEGEPLDVRLGEEADARRDVTLPGPVTAR
ncbi:hypothetical protein GCM10009836_58390 [Pseudonocardia ailaonensis]|uniref:Alpha-amylase n=1 Tax=Pseudonocardia ailaonensis TaxID=367279 RepID=A0ABN2NJY5_9PSEU